MARRRSSIVLRSFLFAVLVTLAMNALDMTYHVLTDTAVHLGYVAVKFTVIFLTVFLIDWLVGRSWKDQVFGSIAGPAIFFVYYLVATPTLDRSQFVIDEAIWYVAVHAVALGLSYWLASTVVKRADGWRHVGRGVLVGVAFTCLDLAYRMVEERLRLDLEGVLSVAVPGYVVWHLVLAVAVVTFVSWVSRVGWRSYVLAGLAVGAVLAWQSAAAGFVTPFGVFVDGIVFGVLAVVTSCLADRVAAQDVSA